MSQDYLIDELKCVSCELYKTSATTNIRRSGIFGRGTGRNGLWFYGESITAEEVNAGLPFVGRSNEFLQILLREVGINENDCFYTTSVRCLLPHNKSPKAENIKTCMGFNAAKDIPSVPPRLIVTLGNVPLKAILGLQKITENRGQFFDSELFKCKVLPTFNPNAIIRDPKKYDTLKEDLIKAREFILDQSEAPPEHLEELINSQQSFDKWMGILSDEFIKEIACDIETTGLDYNKDQIASIAFSIRLDDEYYNVSFLTLPKDGWWSADLSNPEIRSKLQPVLKKPLLFQDGIFDVKFFWKLNYLVNYKNDTVDQHVLIDENSPHNLRYLTGIFNKYNSLENKNEFKALDEFEEGEFYKAKPELLLSINIDDAYNCLLLKNKFDKLLEAEKQTTLYNKIQMPFKRSLTRMSYRGIMMDRKGIISKSDEYRSVIRDKEKELFKLVGKKFKYTSTSKVLPQILFKELNLPIIKRTPSGAPSTDKEVLDELAEINPVPRLIKELRFHKGMIQKYLDGNDLSDEIDPNKGMLCCLDDNDRIHGRFLSFGTISGRPSCTKPNLLNIPKNSDIKSLFIAPEGWSLIEFDYSQAELVLLAYLSGDENFIRDINTSDFHLATARGILKQENVDEFGRRNAKSANFLNSYGGGAEKLSKQLQAAENKQFKDSYKITQKVPLTCTNTGSWYHSARRLIPLEYYSVNPKRKICYVCEADDWLKSWNTLYPKVSEYKNNQKRLWRENNFIEGLYGRKKRFPPAFTSDIESYYDRISVNFMCQNGVGDTINRSIIDIDYLFDLLFGWSPSTLYNIPGIVLTVYDSILIECPDPIVEDVKNAGLEIMTAPLPKLNISLKVDAKVCKRWGQENEDDDMEVEYE